MTNASLNWDTSRPHLPRIPPLRTGDCLDAEEFLRRFAMMSEKERSEVTAELIDGVVYMWHSVSLEFHGHQSLLLGSCLGLYSAAAQGVRGGLHAGVRLGPRDVACPDALLRVLSAYGGASRTSPDGFVAGPPEFVAEVAAGAASCEMHQKQEMYRRHGVPEYFVWCVYDEALHHFALVDGRYERIEPTDGIHRSRALPGLWLDAVALLQGDTARAHGTIQNGVDSAEHHAFVEQLAARKPA